MVPRSAEPFVPPKQSEPFPTSWARGPAAIAVRDGIQRFGLGPLLRHEIKPTVHGLELGGPADEPVLPSGEAVLSWPMAVKLCPLKLNAAGSGTTQTSLPGAPGVTQLPAEHAMPVPR